MAKIIFEGDPEEFAKLFRITESDRQQDAELTLLRIYATGNPHQSALLANLTPLPPPVQYLPSPPPPPTEQVLLPPSPPTTTEQFLLPPSPVSPPSTLIQDSTVIQTQVPSPKFPKLNKTQQRGIAIIAAIALSLWSLDAIAPGILGKSLDGALSLIKGSSSVLEKESEPESEPKSEKESEPESEPKSESESSSDRSLIDRLREAQSQPVVPEGG